MYQTKNNNMKIWTNHLQVRRNGGDQDLKFHNRHDHENKRSQLYKYKEEKNWVGGKKT